MLIYSNYVRPTPAAATAYTRSRKRFVYEIKVKEMEIKRKQDDLGWLRLVNGCCAQCATIFARVPSASSSFRNGIRFFENSIGSHPFLFCQFHSSAQCESFGRTIVLSLRSALFIYFVLCWLTTTDRQQTWRRTKGDNVFCGFRSVSIRITVVNIISNRLNNMSSFLRTVHGAPKIYDNFIMHFLLSLFCFFCSSFVNVECHCFARTKWWCPNVDCVLRIDQEQYAQTTHERYAKRWYWPGLNCQSTLRLRTVTLLCLATANSLEIYNISNIVQTRSIFQGIVLCSR